MKTFFFFLFVLSSVCMLDAQTLADYDLLFPTYEKGTAVMKNGTRMEGDYNYSAINRQIQYIGDNGMIMTFENPKEVVCVTIAGRYFENTPKNGFLERITVNDGAYYVEWAAKWISAGKATAMGQRSQSYSTANFTNTNDGTPTVPIYAKDYGMTTIPEYFYYIKKNDKFKRFNSVSSMAKALGCCKEELKEFVKRENIKFKNPEDIRRMLSFLSGIGR